MKIKVIYDSELNWLKIPVTLKTPHKRVPVFIVFDTGSTSNLLNYLDSRRLNLPFIESAGIACIGGHKYKCYSYNKLEFLFKTTDNEIISQQMPIKILRPTLKSEELSELDDFPNILGLNFLKEGWRFFCDIKNNEIYFEKD